jgi:hypothetical protein
MQNCCVNFLLKTHNIALRFLPDDWRLVSHHSAKELIWGYKDSVLSSLKRFGVADEDTFGYLLHQNHTKSKVFEVYDGSQNVKEQSKIFKWNNRTNLSPIWKSKIENTILGTDGYSFGPILGNNLST